MNARFGWIVMAALAVATPSRAQSNFRSAPVGGRSQLLGGTGLTYGRDAAAAFLNPATAVLVDDQQLSLSMNVYSIGFVYAPRWYVPGPVDRSRFGALNIDNSTMTDLEFDALPSSLCFFFRVSQIHAFVAVESDDPRFKDARLGLCFATVERDTFNFAAEGFSRTLGSSVTRQAQTLAQSFRRFSGGPTYAMRITNELTIGGSIHASLASHRSLLAASATTFGAAPSPITSMFYSGSRGDAFQVNGLVGATLRFGKQTVGLSLQSPSVHIFGVGGANRQSFFDGAGTATQQVSASGSFTSHMPARLGLGTGIEGSWGLAELNTLIYVPMGTSYHAELDGTQTTTTGGVVDDHAVSFDLSSHARGVVNISAGAELNVTDKISLLTGLATDFSAVPSGTLQGQSIFNYYPSQTHRVSGSLGVSSHGEGGDLMFGGEFSVGWGDRLAVNSYQLPPVIGTTGHGTYQMLFIIAGSTNLRTIKRAVDDMREVLTEPKKPKPYNPRQQPQRR